MSGSAVGILGAVLTMWTDTTLSSACSAYHIGVLFRAVQGRSRKGRFVREQVAPKYPMSSNSCAAIFAVTENQNGCLSRTPV